jgi:hypothetical protein
MSTGRTLTDNCEILSKIPESGLLNIPYCRQMTDFLTQVKFLGSYTVPRVAIQLSSAFQSLPGPQIAANRVVTPAQTTLGRPFTNADNPTLNSSSRAPSSGSASISWTSGSRRCFRRVDCGRS